MSSPAAAPATGCLPWLTPGQRQQLHGCLEELGRAPGWSGALPVVLLERCWLRLRRLTVAELACRLPPDAAAEAPELARYRELVAGGLSGWAAELRCWDEFGASSCQAAQRRLWQRQEQGNHGWTLERYGDLVRTYRHSVETAGPRRLPLLVLARPDSPEPHQLHWLSAKGVSMRHTCA